MKAPENTEKFLKKFYMSEQASLTSDSEKNKQVVEDALSAYRRTLNKRPVVVKQNAWRIIMKSRITKLAAAAVIIITVVLGLNLLEIPFDGTSIAFAEVMENMQKIPWVHIVLEIRRTGVQVRQEYWIGFKEGLQGQTTYDGTVSFYDIKKQKQFVYMPKSGEIIVSDYQPRSTKEEDINSADKLLNGLLNDFGISQADMTVERSQRNGVAVNIYKAKVRNNSGDQPKFTAQAEFVVNRQSHLLLNATIQAQGPDQKLVADMKLTYEYPQNAPKDIYDLGVPHTSKIIDRTQ